MAAPSQPAGTPAPASGQEQAQDAAPTGLRTAPHLRTKLIAILVTMLGIACLIIGVSSYIALSSSLMGRAYGQLDEAAHRAVSFKPGGPSSGQSSSTEVDGCQQFNGRTTLDAPGQGPGTLSLCTANGQTVVAGMLDSVGSTQTLSDADQQTLLALSTSDGTIEVDLEVGEYLVVTQDNPVSEGVIVTGVPLAETHRTLAVLVAVIAAGSVAVMIGAGVLGSWIIRVPCNPLSGSRRSQRASPTWTWPSKLCPRRPAYSPRTLTPATR